MVSLIATSRKPDVTFRRNGTIDISAWVCKQLGIRERDIIDVAYDGKDYLLYVRARREDVIGRHAAVCYPTKKSSNNYRCHSVALCREILRLAGAQDIAQLPVGEYRKDETPPHFVLIIRNNLAAKK